MALIDVNGTTLRYEDEGPRTGHAVVMSPSMFFDVRMFEAQAAALSDRFRVVRYDHRGQGESARDARERLEAGATLLQGYTAVIYEGPLWPRTITSALG